MLLRILFRVLLGLFFYETALAGWYGLAFSGHAEIWHFIDKVLGTNVGTATASVHGARIAPTIWTVLDMTESDALARFQSVLLFGCARAMMFSLWPAAWTDCSLSFGHGWRCFVILLWSNRLVRHSMEEAAMSNREYV